MSMNAWHKINDHISVAQELEDLGYVSYVVYDMIIHAIHSDVRIHSC